MLRLALPAQVVASLAQALATLVVVCLVPAAALKADSWVQALPARAVVCSVQAPATLRVVFSVPALAALVAASLAEAQAAQVAVSSVQALATQGAVSLEPTAVWPVDSSVQAAALGVGSSVLLAATVRCLAPEAPLSKLRS